MKARERRYTPLHQLGRLALADRWIGREEMRMEYSGAGGLGAVSAGISEELLWLLGLVVLILVIAGGWKLLKLVWAVFSG